MVYELLDLYNGGIEPLENWATADIVKLGYALDAELQLRHDEAGKFFSALMDTESEYDPD